MGRGTPKRISAVGTTGAEAASRRAIRSPTYRAELERFTPYEQIARIVIKRRMQLGLSQQQVAKRMGTSNTAISRIESGRHPTKQATLARLAEALEMRYMHGFEIRIGKTRTVKELIAI